MRDARNGSRKKRWKLNARAARSARKRAAAIAAPSVPRPVVRGSVRPAVQCRVGAVAGPERAPPTPPPLAFRYARAPTRQRPDERPAVVLWSRCDPDGPEIHRFPSDREAIDFGTRECPFGAVSRRLPSTRRGAGGNGAVAVVGRDGHAEGRGRAYLIRSPPRCREQ